MAKMHPDELLKHIEERIRERGGRDPEETAKRVFDGLPKSPKVAIHLRRLIMIEMANRGESPGEGIYSPFSIGDELCVSELKVTDEEHRNAVLQYIEKEVRLVYGKGWYTAWKTARAMEPELIHSLSSPEEVLSITLDAHIKRWFIPLLGSIKGTAFNPDKDPRHKQAVHFYAMGRSIKKDKYLSEDQHRDVAQRVLTAVCTSLENFDRTAPPGSWVEGIFKVVRASFLKSTIIEEEVVPYDEGIGFMNKAEDREAYPHWILAVLWARFVQALFGRYRAEEEKIRAQHGQVPTQGLDYIGEVLDVVNTWDPSAADRTSSPWQDLAEKWDNALLASHEMWPLSDVEMESRVQNGTFELMRPMCSTSDDGFLLAMFAFYTFPGGERKHGFNRAAARFLQMKPRRVEDQKFEIALIRTWISEQIPRRVVKKELDLLVRFLSNVKSTGSNECTRLAQEIFKDVTRCDPHEHFIAKHDHEGWRVLNEEREQLLLKLKKDLRFDQWRYLVEGQKEEM